MGLLKRLGKEEIHCFEQFLLLPVFHLFGKLSIIFIKFNPFPRQIFDSTKLRELADNSFQYDETSKRVENTVGKGEIACNKQFLLFLQRFQKTCAADT